jgi:hypothetical protein
MDDNKRKSLFIGNLSPALSNDALKKYFTDKGYKLQSVKII